MLKIFDLTSRGQRHDPRVSEAEDRDPLGIGDPVGLRTTHEMVNDGSHVRGAKNDGNREGLALMPLAILFQYVDQVPVAPSDQDLTIQNLADRTRMSRRNFIRRFEEATGMPVEDVTTVAGFGTADALRH